MVTSLLLALAIGASTPQLGDLNPFTMQADPLMVAHRPEVQKELKLSKDQARDVDALFKDAYGGSKRGDPNDISSGMRQMQVLQDDSKKILDVLDGAQRERLQQIRHQMLGPVCLSEPDVQKAVGLSAGQIGQVNKIREDASAQFFDALQHGGHGRGMSHKMQDVSDQTAAKLLAILDDAQKTKYEALLGPPFKGARPKEFYPY